MNTAKPWYVSKTIWANGITVAVAMLGFLAGSNVIMAYPKVVSALLLAMGLLNIGLRFLTSAPVKTGANRL